MNPLEQIVAALDRLDQLVAAVERQPTEPVQIADDNNMVRAFVLSPQHFAALTGSARVKPHQKRKPTRAERRARQRAKGHA